jgi:acrylyl-CoA reductase (NADPH)
MEPETFRAMVIEQLDGRTVAALKDLPRTALPEGDVTVRVTHSSLNYKDGLAVTGRGKVVRRFPMVAGIDLAGVVLDSSSSAFQPGDPVLATGQGIGELHFGGFAGLARVRKEWLFAIPPGLDARQAMALGTAGLTAMLCVLALEGAGIAPGEREVLVTGAAGGVGSLAVALLAARGYKVAASTGRPETHAYLRELGAQTLIDRATLATRGPGLGSERWAAAVDTVGGQTLATVLSQTAYRGAVAACGLAGGSDVPASVFPFILRNVALLGVDSVNTPRAVRETAWARLGRELPAARLDAIATVAPMSRLPALAEDILAGRVRGRVVIDTTA